MLGILIFSAMPLGGTYVLKYCNCTDVHSMYLQYVRIICSYVGAEQLIVCPGDVSYECVDSGAEDELDIEWRVYCHTSPASSENSCQSMSNVSPQSPLLTCPSPYNTHT